VRGVFEGDRQIGYGDKGGGNVSNPAVHFQMLQIWPFPLMGLRSSVAAISSMRSK
jgi:hypothetical protein